LIGRIVGPAWAPSSSHKVEMKVPRRVFSVDGGSGWLAARSDQNGIGGDMHLFDMLGIEVEGPEGPVQVEATFAALPPNHGGPTICTRERFLGEVRDRAGRRWHAMIEDRHARFLGPADE
jgi:hypothetical protein